MKRTLLLLLSLALAPACMPANAATPSPMLPIIEFASTQTLTQAAPTLTTDGISLSHTLAFRASVCVIGGNLTASGNLRAWVYVPTQLQWIHNPSMDLAITNTGVPCQLWGDISSSIHRGQFKMVDDSVGASAGTTAQVLIEAVVQ